MKKSLIDLIQKFDLGFCDVQLVGTKVLTSHRRSNSEGATEEFLFDIKTHPFTDPPVNPATI